MQVIRKSKKIWLSQLPIQHLRNQKNKLNQVIQIEVEKSQKTKAKMLWNKKQNQINKYKIHNKKLINQFRIKEIMKCKRDMIHYLRIKIIKTRIVLLLFWTPQFRIRISKNKTKNHLFQKLTTKEHLSQKLTIKEHPKILL